jgi:hypothetical protein
MIINDNSMYNKYIITSTILILICILLNLKYINNSNINNNIIFKVLFLILIYLIINKYTSVGLFLTLIYLILDQLVIYKILNNDLKQLEHS